MKTTLFTLIAVWGLALPAKALDVKAIASKPTADNPQYDNKKVWPKLVGDEYFQKQKWDKARLLIWNIHGKAEMIGGRRGGLDGRNPANWINAATGKPAKSIPDMDTDMILPDSDTPYTVNFHCVEGSRISYCRHVTIGRNATIRMAGHPHRNSIRFFGNVWVRATGRIETYGHMYFIGDHDTFLRQDWPEDGKLKKMHDKRLVAPFDPKAKLNDQPWSRGRITYFLIHNKKEGKSTEVIGFVSTGDEVGIKSGIFIVGRDSRFLSIGPASMSVNKGAKVVLMDGAMCSHGQNQFGNKDWNVAGGAEVTGGTPDRPLKRDAYFGVGYRNWMNLPIPGLKNHRKKANQTTGPKLYYGYGRYNAYISGDLIGYPAQGSDARLVVCWQRISSGGAGSWGRGDEAFKKVFPRIAPKIGVFIGGASMLKNVRFDDLHRGGIVVPNANVFKSWKNITFGAGCLSKDPKELIREVDPKKGEKLAPDKKYTTK
ncbi:MAG: hypothetical protein ISS78_03220 [Phycisphaerae bacterium]|nr:hypothetical protein [Phycisphaerae bacterium]